MAAEMEQTEKNRNVCSGDQAAKIASAAWTQIQVTSLQTLAALVIFGILPFGCLTKELLQIDLRQGLGPRKCLK